MTDDLSPSRGPRDRSALDADAQFERITRGFSRPAGVAPGAGLASLMASATSAVNLLAAVWLVIAPGALGYSGDTTATWNEVGVGVALGVFALCRVLAPLTTVTLSLVNTVLGVWLIVSPLLAGIHVGSAGGSTWTQLITGIVVVCLSVGSAAAAAQGTRAR